ncbi:MAG: PD40 domain-containing protein [Candidatus Saganbacteria bacterium]|nr:PD40 domain-containing protein [Candidatus Saganbacteria bacterium]
MKKLVIIFLILLLSTLAISIPANAFALKRAIMYPSMVHLYLGGLTVQPHNIPARMPYEAIISFYNNEYKDPGPVFMSWIWFWGARGLSLSFSEKTEGAGYYNKIGLGYNIMLFGAWRLRAWAYQNQRPSGYTSSTALETGIIWPQEIILGHLDFCAGVEYGDKREINPYLKLGWNYPIGLPFAFGLPWGGEPDEKDKDKYSLIVNDQEQEIQGSVLDYWFSPNNKRTACRVRNNSREFMVIDGIKGEEFDRVKFWGFSPDSRRFAYEGGGEHVERQGGSTYRFKHNTYMIVDGIKGEKFVKIDDFKFSPDSRRTAYLAPRGRKKAGYVLVVDGKVGEGFEKINFRGFSADSKIINYTGEKDGREFMVINGKKIEAAEKSRYSHFYFSPDRSKVAYVAMRDEGWTKGRKWWAVVNGKKGKAYDWIKGGFEGINFSPNGKKWAYFAKKDSSYFIVINGKKKKSFRDANAIKFAPNSGGIAFYVRSKGKGFLMINGKKGEEFDGARGFSYSPNGKRYAYSVYNKVKKGKKRYKRFLVIDGKKKETRSWLRSEDFTFSPDSKKILYVDNKIQAPDFIVVNGKKGKKHSFVSRYRFSPNSKRLAYTAIDNAKWFVVIDNKKSSALDEVDLPIFSPNSKRVAYKAKNFSKKEYVVVDGKKGEEFEMVGAPLFSPNSKKIAYWAKNGNSWYVIIDGKKRGPFRKVGKLKFSPDSKSFAYTVDR